MFTISSMGSQASHGIFGILAQFGLIFQENGCLEVLFLGLEGLGNNWAKNWKLEDWVKEEYARADDK